MKGLGCTGSGEKESVKLTNPVHIINPLAFVFFETTRERGGGWGVGAAWACPE